jgi:RNA polymerase sigma-70 factor (ECF subfamily)
MAHLDDDGREDVLRGSAENLYARFHAPLIRYFRKRIGDRAEAEDLAQEVFVRLVKAEGTFSLASADAYVFTIAANLLRDRQRRAASHQLQAHCSLDQAADGKYADLVEAIEPERVLRGREDLKLVLEALAELDERTRNIFLLFRLERLRQREIAAIYGISEGAVEKRILKASIHIAARLKERK